MTLGTKDYALRYSVMLLTQMWPPFLVLPS
jgi:hypothetical protein